MITGNHDDLSLSIDEIRAAEVVDDEDGRDPTDNTPPIVDTADHLHDDPPHPTPDDDR